MAEYQRPIIDGSEGVKDAGGIIIFDKYNDQPLVGQETDSRDIIKDRLPV